MQVEVVKNTRKRKKKQEIPQSIKKAEDLLAEIKKLKSDYEKLKDECNDEIQKIKEKYSEKLAELKSNLMEHDKEIKKLLKKYRRDFFADTDRKQLKNGLVWWRIKQAVKKARNVTVQLLEQLGYTDGIKIEKRVNWAEIEKWSDEKLAAIGTERTEKEEFGYEI